LPWFGVGVAILWSGAASADIETFYKTDVCPNFGGLKPPIAMEVGTMEVATSLTTTEGVGGPFCNLLSLPKRAAFIPMKALAVANAQAIVNPGDIVDPPGVPGDTWLCVVCQYEDKVAAHPALSVFGTALLMGGLVTAMLYELRRRQSGAGA
jgi:hypothetical protein